VCLCVCVCLCVAVCGCVWLCVAVCGCVWLCGAVCGCVWLCGLCGCVTVSRCPAFIDPSYYEFLGKAARDQHPDHDVAEGEQLIKEVRVRRLFCRGSRSDTAALVFVITSEPTCCSPAPTRHLHPPTSPTLFSGTNRICSCEDTKIRLGWWLWGWGFGVCRRLVRAGFHILTLPIIHRA
jgi:hypothetical protein